MAQRNALENDEIFSQYSIQRLTYAEILQGKIPEGNNFPLFYVSQKLLFDFTRFRLDPNWHAKQDICNPDAQMWMRLLPVMCASIAITLIFYFFACHYNIWAGVLALALALTSPMVWIYWAQARPYGLWLLISVCQLLLLIKGRQSMIIHFLLCLTTPFGVAQTVIAALILRKRYLWPMAAPAVIGLLYYVQAPRYLFRVPHPAFELITGNFPLERIILLLICAVWIIYHWRNTKNHAAAVLLAYSLASFVVPIFIIAYYMVQNVQGNAGFELSARYFIFLTPLSTIVTMLVWVKVWNGHASNIWMRLHLAQGIAGVLALGAIHTWVAAQRLLV